MPRIDENTRLQRLERLLILIQRHDRGLTEAEIAEELQFERRSTNNYLRDLENEGKVFKDGLYWYPLKLKESRLRSFDLSPEEALTLYLGARLLVKQQDKRNEPAETALMKLAEVLHADAGVGGEIEQAALELSGRPVQEGYQPVFRDVVRAYIYRKKVELTYKPLGWDKSFHTLFSTYLLEPSLIGFSTYLIGFSSAANALRAYKLERIIAARLTSESYLVPNEFPGLEILQNSWSIVLGEETLLVDLRFSPRVRERVLETRWHPSQISFDDPERPGWLRWQVQVADTLDMLSWIRGWGADVEVLEPKELRRSLIKEVRKLSGVYLDNLPVEENICIAHYRERDRTIQPLVDHLEQTSILAEKFAAKIGLGNVGRLLGLLHDVGKASTDFQNYIGSATGLIDPLSDNYVNYKALKGKIDHSTAGAQIIFRFLTEVDSPENRTVGQILALCLVSHHSGLIDCLSPDGEDVFASRIKKSEEKTYLDDVIKNLNPVINQAKGELSANSISDLLSVMKSIKGESKEVCLFKYGLLVRYLLSCLLDADRLDTADFEFPKNFKIRNYGSYPSWGELIKKLNDKLEEIKNNSERTSINELRDSISNACFENAAKPRGIFKLSVPTGGGKTLASLRFALHHANENKLDRVFYIIPYTSIIDQNAKVVRDIFEDEGHTDIVLEHHSNLTPEEETKKQSLLSENWDAPIVFTTQVQFLEALFGSGTRGARRMHQLANSVIIFDEIQTLPVTTVHLFNTAIQFLVETCNSSVVLCSATQPLLDQVRPVQRALKINYSMIKNERELNEKLKRIKIINKCQIGGWEEDQIAGLVKQELIDKGSVLIITNTKKSARRLFQTLEETLSEVALFHLSTNMCPVHRLSVIESIRDLLEKDLPVVCVSTQLIEAGVDIDFGSVIRYIAGLDSIVQAAGRCNRNGKQKGPGKVFIINPKDENVDRLPDIKKGIEITERIFEERKDDQSHDILNLDVMNTYYQYYFHQRGTEMNYPLGEKSNIGRSDNLFDLLSVNQLSFGEFIRTHSNNKLSGPFCQSFQSAARAFHVIDSITSSVVVPYNEEGEQLIAELCGAFEIKKQYKLIKKAQRFSVNLFSHEFRNLVKNGAVFEVQEGAGIYYLSKEFYHEKYGWCEGSVNQMQDLIF